MKDAAVVAGPLLRRRALLPLAALLGAGGPALGRPAVPRPDPGPSEHLTLLVAGPPRGTVDRWAALLAPVLARSFPAGTVVGREAAGAADGVTGANQFETRTSPDGGTALLLPGAATQAWLVGDPRAQFDATRWVIALASVTPVVLASRIPLARIRPGARVRVAAAGPAGHDLPGLLAVELLGAEVVPVFGAGLDAVLRGEADATLLRGRGIMPAVQACTDAGAPGESYAHATVRTLDWEVPTLLRANASYVRCSPLGAAIGGQVVKLGRGLGALNVLGVGALEEAARRYAADPAAAERFLRGVSSAVALWNASTQFCDGGEFGFGAEIGIATGRLHARGPVGVEQLTTYRYIITGTGQVRP